MHPNGSQNRLKKEEKNKNKGMHVVVFITFLSPGPHLLYHIFLMK
jgi:hypothetical protein